MTDTSAGTNHGAKEAASSGRGRRHGRLARCIKFSCDWACRWQPKCGLQNGVEPRARDRASAGGGPGSVDVERVVCGRRLSSARPRDGAKRAPAAVARWMIH